MRSDNQYFNNVILVSGPVIIKDGKVLVNKHGESNLWKFPGGDITEPNGEPTDWAKRKSKEELGIEIEIIRPLSPMVVWEKDRIIVLFHYLAELASEEIRPAGYVKEYAWLDIENLPDDCSPNIKAIIAELG